MRNQLDRYAAPARVDWHCASINNRWTKRGLASAGFGYPSPHVAEGPPRRWKPIFSVAEIGGSSSAAAVAENREIKDDLRRRTRDEEQKIEATTTTADGITKAGGPGSGRSLEPERAGSAVAWSLSCPERLFDTHRRVY